MREGLWRELIQEVEIKVRHLYASHTPDSLIYHNIRHTESVVMHATEIANYYKLDAETMFILQTAAWFHDTGQLFSMPAWHEEESVRLVNQYLEEHVAIPTRVITAIDSCIMATKMPQRAHSLTEQVLCDADLYHLGTSKFWEINETVKQEFSRRGFDVSNWETGTLKLLQTHHYYTDYCKKLLNAGKGENMEKLMVWLNDHPSA